MSLSVVAGTLGLVLWASVCWAVAWGLARVDRSDGISSPRTTKWRLIGPVLASVTTLGFVLGWAYQEPNPPDEQLGSVMLLLGGLSLVVVLRAFWRAFAALRPVDPTRFPVATVGLFRPRVSISSAFRERVSPEVLAAAQAHERAHARAFDPLRIWLAQLGADLQWPIPGAERALQAWLLQLELRRDEDALAAGAEPEALAEAILAAGLLQSARPAPPTAGLVGARASLKIRIRRLLSGGGPSLQPDRPLIRFLRGSLWIAAFALTLWLGARHGDVLVGLLPGVAR